MEEKKYKVMDDREIEKIEDLPDGFPKSMMLITSCLCNDETQKDIRIEVPTKELMELDNETIDKEILCKFLNAKNRKF